MVDSPEKEVVNKRDSNDFMRYLYIVLAVIALGILIYLLIPSEEKSIEKPEIEVNLSQSHSMENLERETIEKYIQYLVMKCSKDFGAKHEMALATLEDSHCEDSEGLFDTSHCKKEVAILKGTIKESTRECNSIESEEMKKTCISIVSGEGCNTLSGDNRELCIAITNNDQSQCSNIKREDGDSDCVLMSYLVGAVKEGTKEACEKNSIPETQKYEFAKPICLSLVSGDVEPFTQMTLEICKAQAYPAITWPTGDISYCSKINKSADLGGNLTRDCKELKEKLVAGSPQSMEDCEIITSQELKNICKDNIYKEMYTNNPSREICDMISSQIIRQECIEHIDFELMNKANSTQTCNDIIDKEIKKACIGRVENNLDLCLESSNTEAKLSCTIIVGSQMENPPCERLEDEKLIQRCTDFFEENPA